MITNKIERVSLQALMSQIIPPGYCPDAKLAGNRSDYADNIGRQIHHCISHTGVLFISVRVKNNSNMFWFKHHQLSIPTTKQISLRERHSVLKLSLKVTFWIAVSQELSESSDCNKNFCPGVLEQVTKALWNLKNCKATNEGVHLCLLVQHSENSMTSSSPSWMVKSEERQRRVHRSPGNKY